VIRGPVDVVAFSFAPEEPSAVVAQMDRLGAAHKGWINIVPEVREEDEPDQPVGLGTLFSATGPDVPICTWTPGKEGRRGVERDSLGIQHASGTKVVARLATLGVPVPDDWRWTQDHPKRGLVVRVPLGVAHGTELTWLLAAASALSRVRLTGQWAVRVRPGR
jgi:hypothetical protein